jgi:hypothetical protein
VIDPSGIVWGDGIIWGTSGLQDSATTVAIYGEQ